jgi:hypothetical protein
MSPSKRKLVVLGLVAAALTVGAVVLQAVLRTDPMELVDGLDTDALEWGDEEVTTQAGLVFDRHLYGDVEAETVREAVKKTLEELGYSATKAGPHTRPDGAALAIEVTVAEDGRVGLLVTPGKLKLAGEFEGGAFKAYKDEVARHVGEFFTALFRHLPSDAAGDPPTEPGKRER